mgnify:CR=1 FL=1
MDAALLSPWLTSFGLILCRVTGLMLGLPVISFEIAPLLGRAALAALISIALSLGMPTLETLHILPIAMLLELIYGLCMGFVVRLSLSAAEMAGEIIAMQMGFAMAKMVNPMSKEPVSPITSLIVFITGILFFVSNGHHEILRVLAGSFYISPPGGLTLENNWYLVLLMLGGELFWASLRIAAPMMIIIFATYLSFALLTRMAQQLNVWAMGFLATIGVGLGGFLIFMPALVSEIGNMVSRSTETLGRFVGL